MQNPLRIFVAAADFAAELRDRQIIDTLHDLLAKDLQNSDKLHHEAEMVYRYRRARKATLLLLANLYRKFTEIPKQIVDLFEFTENEFENVKTKNVRMIEA